jgi:AcrR family transcriptional regulator
MTLKGRTVQAPAARNQEGSAVLILETAEQLCAERGLESVSIRDIAKGTGLSVSVIYHHYGSKANLLRTILQTRLAEAGAVRAAMFADLEADPKPDLRAILYAIFAPSARLRSEKSGRQATYKFLSRALVSTIPEIKEEVDAVVILTRPLVRLLERALPHLSHAEVCWRLHFTFGIEHMTHLDDARLAIMSEGKCDGTAIEESIERAIAFAEAAFLAPPLSVKPKSSRRKR